jgi:pimeloyl-ACP methyl ester carboxylesterase
VPSESLTTGFAPVNGVDMYWESRGSGGIPLVVVHGGYGLTSMFSDLLDDLADGRRVVAIELQGHGHTRDIDRPFSFEAFGDDIAGLIDSIGADRADLLGCSLGGLASLRCAIQHPDKLRKLGLVSIPCRRSAWFPEVVSAFDQMSSAGFDQMRRSPMYKAWTEVAPDRDSFPALMDKTGDLLRRPYDWTEEVKGLSTPTLLVYADSDSIPTAHAAEFFSLLGGGLKDAGLDGSGKTDMRLAILPGRTHYDVFSAPQLAGLVAEFFS